VARDGGPWYLAANTDQQGPHYYGSLDFQSYGSGVIRMWKITQPTSCSQPANRWGIPLE
jgi:hypothetical protein